MATIKGIGNGIMRSHVCYCYPAEVDIPAFNPAYTKAGTRRSYPVRFGKTGYKEGRGHRV